MLCTSHTRSRWRALTPLVLLFYLTLPLPAAALRHRDTPATLPAEIASTHFTVTLNGKSAPVAHAAANYYFLNFDLAKPVEVTITADSDSYWSKGVEVQPWRLGIRPSLSGRTIRFSLSAPAKISITRPGDYLGGAEMLFLFANPPEGKTPTAASPSLRYYGPGIHRENIDARSGDQIYLAPGAVVFGAINIWEVENVHIFGRGVVVYDGPQNPAEDDSWIHKKNWHAIVMHNARNISIEGITCVVRSRTWMIQMRDSHDIHYTNIKVIGGSPGNANQDGMDWLGGGDTLVQDSFFRAADDIFAMQGNWEGYGAAAFAIPGHEVSNIVVEGSVLSTSISNVVRSGWPQKNFNSHHFVLRNSDVLHMGSGACGIPFALMEFWGNPEGTGQHSDYSFENIRLEDWYSLVQLQQPSPGISDVRFRDISALELPSLAPSSLLGSVSGVVFDNVRLAAAPAQRDADLPIHLSQGAAEPSYSTSTAPPAAFTYSPTLVTPGSSVSFSAAQASAAGAANLTFEWIFGDGTRATGPEVRHRFPDAEGTVWDHSGRFRVLLHVSDSNGRNSWTSQPVIVTGAPHPAVSARDTEPGLLFTSSEMTGAAPSQAGSATIHGSTALLDSTRRMRSENYVMTFDGYLTVPTDGGYTLSLLSNDTGRLVVDNVELASSPTPWPQVCGSPGNAVRAATGSLGLLAGPHTIHVETTHSTGDDGFAVLWQGPGVPQAKIPGSALSHQVQPNSASE